MKICIWFANLFVNLLKMKKTKITNLETSELTPAQATEKEIKLSILLPVRNESANLKVMLVILKAVTEVPHEVLVICDFPEDTSIPVVKALQPGYPNLRLVLNTLGRGVINAIRTGVKASVGKYILIYAVDEIAPILALEDMMALLDEGCDFVSGTRYAHGGRRLGGTLVGGMLSRIANWLLRSLVGSVLSDSTTGIKMFHRSVFERLHLKARPVGWAVVFEMSIKAQLIGLKLGEVPVTSIDRLYGGKSTFRLGPWFVEYLRWFWWGAIQLRRTSGCKRTQVMVRIPVAMTT